MSVTQEAISISEAKSELPGLVRRLTSGRQDRALLMRHSHPVAVILSVETYDRMQALIDRAEHLDDAIALARAAEVNDGTTYSLADLDAKFGPFD